MWKMAGVLRCCAVLVVLTTVGAEFQTDYVTESCGTVLTSRITGRLETSRSLTYANNKDCQMTLAVTSGKRVILYAERFELEDRNGIGRCHDYLTVHDGRSATYPRLYAAYQLCGDIWEQFNVTTTDNHVTFHFVSDSSAVYRGFSFLYSAFSLAPCGAGDFACDNGLCMDESVACDDINQCGDNSDESRCPLEDPSAEEGPDLALIIGCTVAGLVLLVIVIVVIVKVYRYYKWGQFVRMGNHNDGLSDLYEYPITDKYNRHEVGIKGRRQPDVKPYFNVHNVLPPEQETRRYIDEL